MMPMMMCSPSSQEEEEEEEEEDWKKNSFRNETETMRMLSRCARSKSQNLLPRVVASIAIDDDDD